MRISDWSSDVCSSDLAVDALRSRIAIRARDRIIHHETVAAVQLHAFVDDAALHVRTPVFGSGRGRRRKLVLQYQLDAAIDIDLCDLPFGLHLGELEARVLVTRDRTAEDLTLLDVLDRRLERSEERRLGKECGSTCR